jgi:hypothetical protein
MVIATALMIAFTTLAAAQSEAAKAVYDASAIVPTNVRGIRTFNAPPPGFDPRGASDEELATYGYPPRPPQGDEHYATWAKAMAAAKNRWNGPLKVTNYWNGPMRPAKAPAEAAANTTATGPTLAYSYNWSGIANTNTLEEYSETTSFYYVMSDFNVPTAQQAFKSGAYESGNICDGNWDLASVWNGIDGFSNGDVLQGGTISGALCSGGETSYWYQSWIEWWPSYAMIGEFYVKPGDDFFVVTWDTSSTQGYVFLEDLTTETWGTWSLTPTTTPYLVGNSAEYVVERPCCIGSYFYPLANYVQDFWADSLAVDFTDYNKGIATPYYPGSTSPSTYLINMVNDQDTQVISYPAALGKYGIWFQDAKCVLFGGCTFNMNPE